MTDRGYERISLDTERSGSIVKQTSRIDGYGSDVVHYRDESVSGSKIRFADRPEGKRLMDDLRKGDRVLVTRIDRAARNVRDLLDIVERIEKIGASIVFIEQNIDTSGPMGKFLLVLLGAVAELEANIIGERRRESLVSFIREGRHAVGAAPYGFKSVENPNGRGLVIRPDWDITPPLVRSPAASLREAIERVLAGEPYARICEDLPIGKTGLSGLLRNPRLAGMTPTNGGVVMTGGVPRIDPEAALLSMGEWSRLRDHVNQIEKRPKVPQEGYGGALICHACGVRLYISKAARDRPENITYKCQKNRHKPGIPGVSVMKANADAHLRDTFLSKYGDRDVVTATWTNTMDIRQEAVAYAQVHLDAAQEAFLGDLDDDEEAAVIRALRDAKKALRAAEDIPDERAYLTQRAGCTVRELWERVDHFERVRLLNLAGAWVVQPGQRLTIDEKIKLKDEGVQMELELLTHAHGSQSPEHDDQNTFFVPDLI